jgi:hypothetical protein
MVVKSCGLEPRRSLPTPFSSHSFGRKLRPGFSYQRAALMRREASRLSRVGKDEVPNRRGLFTSSHQLPRRKTVRRAKHGRTKEPLEMWVSRGFFFIFGLSFASRGILHGASEPRSDCVLCGVYHLYLFRLWPDRELSRPLQNRTGDQCVHGLRLSEMVYP